MIHIDEMILRLPGMEEAEGQQLGRDVARGLAARLPDYTGDRRMDELNVQLTLAPGLSRGQMAAAITTQIVRQLQPGME